MSKQTAEEYIRSLSAWTLDGLLKSRSLLPEYRKLVEAELRYRQENLT